MRTALLFLFAVSLTIALSLEYTHGEILISSASCYLLGVVAAVGRESKFSKWWAPSVFAGLLLTGLDSILPGGFSHCLPAVVGFFYGALDGERVSQFFKAREVIQSIDPRSKQARIARMLSEIEPGRVVFHVGEDFNFLHWKDVAEYSHEDEVDALNTESFKP